MIRFLFKKINKQQDEQLEYKNLTLNLNQNFFLPLYKNTPYLREPSFNTYTAEIKKLKQQLSIDNEQLILIGLSGNKEVIKNVKNRRQRIKLLFLAVANGFVDCAADLNTLQKELRAKYQNLSIGGDFWQYTVFAAFQQAVENSYIPGVQKLLEQKKLILESGISKAETEHTFFVSCAIQTGNPCLVKIFLDSFDYSLILLNRLLTNKLVTNNLSTEKIIKPLSPEIYDLIKGKILLKQSMIHIPPDMILYNNQHNAKKRSNNLSFQFRERTMAPKKFKRR